MAVTIYNGEYTELNTRKQAGFLAGKTSLGVENDTTRANTEIRVGFVETIKGTSHTMRVAAWSVSDIEDALNIRNYRVEYDIEFTYSGKSYTISGNGTGTVNSNIKYCPDLSITIDDSTRGKKFSITVTKVSCKLFQKKLFGSSYDRAGAVSFTGSGTASVTTATSIDLTYRISSSTGIILKTISGTPTKPLTQNYDTINSDDGHYQYSDWTSVDTGQSAPKGTTVYPGDRIYSGSRVLLKYNLTLRYNSKITTNTDGQSMVLGEFTPQQKVTLPAESDLTFTLDSSHMILGVTDINRNGNRLPNGATKFALGSTVKLDVQTSDNDELFIHLVVIDKNIEYNVIPKLDSVSDSRYKFSVNFPYSDTYKQYTYFSNTHKVKYGELIKASVNDIFIDNAFELPALRTLLTETCPEITLHNNGEGSYAKDNIQLVASLVNTRGTGVKSYYCSAKYNQASPYSTIVGLFTNSYDTSTYVIVASQTRDNCKLYCDGEESTAPIVEIEGTGYYVSYHQTPQSNGVDNSPFKRRNIGSASVPPQLINDPLGSMIQQIGQDLLRQRGNHGEAIGERKHYCFRDISVVPAMSIRMTNISNIKSEGTWKKGLLYKKIDGVWRQLLPFQKSGNWDSLGRKFVVNYPSTGIKLVDPSDKYFRLNMYNHGKDVSSYWIQVSDTKQEPMPDDYFISRNQALSYVYVDSPVVVEENSDGSGLVVMNRDRWVIGITGLSLLTTSEDVLSQLKSTILSKLVVTIKDERQELPYQFLYENGEHYVPGVSDKSNFSSSVTDFFNESSKVQADIAINFGSPSQEGKVSIIYTVKLLSSDINFDSSEVSCEVSLKNPGSSIFTEDQTQVYASCISSGNFQGIVSHEVSQNSVTKRFDDIQLDSSPFHYDILNTHNSGFLTIVVVQTTDLTI